ncbi:MAG: Xaa-Pro peptidase family protein [Phycisphaerales bacterium]
MLMDTSNLKHRLKKVRQKLKAEKIDAFLVTNPVNITYLTGFKGDDSWLLITANSNILITDSRYTLQAKKECALTKIYERKGKMIDAVCEILKKNPNIDAAAVEDTIPLATFKALKKQLPIRVKEAKNFIESIRLIKDASEIEKIKQSAAIAENALNKVLPKIRIGMTEIEVAAIIDSEIKKHGAIPSFDTNVSFGPNSAMPHHRPDMTKLKKIDTILIDYGAKMDCYCSDITRCFAVGKVDDFYAKVYKTVLEAQTSAINILKAGLEAFDADEAAKEIIKKENLTPYGHGLGHGMGLEIHEAPAVSFMSRAKLQTGNVISVEPGVYLDNKFGIRIEDDVLITNTGCEILTTLLKSDEVPLLLKI